MPNIFELIFYATVNYIPYMFLALYPFRDTFRFTRLKTRLIFCSFAAFSVISFSASYYLGQPFHIISTYIITALCLAVYFLCVKSRWRRMLFNLFMLKNIANFVVVVSKYLESILFPTSNGTEYQWTNTLCMMILLVPLMPLILYILHNFFTKRIRDSIDLKIWKALWLVPVFFYAIWMYIFYFCTSGNALQFALKPSSSIFMLFYLCGQLLIYICIAKLVINFNTSVYLTEENHRLTDQSLQYRNIQDRIHEITEIKHDFRHHLLTMCNYADSGKYNELKNYLHNYVDTIPENRVSYCANVPLNLLLVYYAQRCSNETIDFKATINLPAEIALTDSEITVMFGNLLENAADACSNVEEKDRKLSIAAKLMQKQFIFIIENSCNNELLTDSNGAVFSTKHSGYGIGLASVKNIVEKHNGSIDISNSNSIFSVSIILPEK